ncbi:MAG: Lpg1974 family pore-forming outer membrane protein [Simkaniaceae bacterium]|nr:Lpg1974 family pore-forming outer membrane protein [Candidatus Sacchlamyda saccharinae]
MLIDLQADALFFQALENGVGFAIHEERIVNPNFKYHFGAKAKLGITAGADCWTLSAEFLHYHARTHTWDHMWRLHMGLGDALLSRLWHTSNTLSLKPLWGLRYGEIRHKLKENSAICMKNKFWGLGPKMGFEGIFSICPPLDLFLRGAASILFGKCYLHQDLSPLKFYDDFHQNRTLFESALGLRFTSGCFYGQAAFEVHLFPGQNQLAHFTSTPGKYVTNQGDLSLHGLSFGLGACF